jgi:putative ABC transport system substrate-binding protein
MPVAFPPGRLRLMARPALTGSSTLLKTIGMVEVAALAAAFEAMSAKRVDAFIIELGTIRPETAELAIKHWLPSSGPRAWPSAGGLIGYSGNFAEIHRLAADYVDKILKGRRPADLPVALPTKFDLTVNLKTAKALGLEIPSSVLDPLRGH